ncbi:hypothetical protein [Paracoccus marinaquae]|uniref:Alpha/beta hydrolase n=1 Tax=Paracoccus marinaquae TaxID=2841926 RepID=A0ABS6AD09_9RHOB|nr:hypothetical protein [Paracoccus marinaquae]MBU3028499.1 hypothetical protein [Paracoccus marinaquae]
MTHKLPEIRSVQNGDAVIAYAVTGPADPASRTICLIASTGRGAEDFFHLAEHLAAGGMRVVMP